MSRPMLLVFLLIILIVTSQFEWRQPLVSEAVVDDTNQKQQQRISNREEAVKEKIILSQEKSIHKLSQLVRSLRQQLSECRSKNGSTNASLSNLTETIIELERQQFMDD